MRHRVPIMIQAGPSDCGAVCMAMLLSAVRGRRLPVTELDELRGLADRDGMSVLTVRRALEARGLPVRALRLKDVGDLRAQPTPAIALCTEHHFVVVESTAKRYVQICDPAIGKKRLGWDEFRQRFTGVAVVFPEPRRRPVKGPLAGLIAMATTSVPYRFARVWPRALRRPVYTVLALSILLEVVSAGTILLLREVLNGSGAALASSLLIGLALIAVLQLMGQLGRGLLVARCTTDGETTMRQGSFSKILTLGFGYFQYRPPGYLSSLLASTRQLNDAFFVTVVDGVMGFTAGGIALALLFAINWLAGVTVAAMVGLVFFGCLLARRRISSAAKVEFEQRARLASVTDEVFRAIEGVRGIDAEPGANRLWSRHSVLLARSARLSRMWGQAASAVAVGSAQILQVGVITVVVVLADSQLAAGNLVAVVGFSATAFTPLLEASRRTLRWGEIDVLLSQLSDVWERPEAGLSEATGADGAFTAFSLDQVQVGFGAHPPLIKDATFSIGHGERLGISAPSGAGKSTLLRAVAGMVEPQAGTISVDGTTIAAARARGFRSAYVPQEGALLAGTIAENLRIGAMDATGDELWEACRQAQIADDIERFPHQMDTLLSAGGAGLSGGQRQRLAVARALLTRPRLLILDEATSALDYSLEERLFRGLPPIALLVVSHRAEVMRAMDRVFLLEDGRLREQVPDEASREPAAAAPIELADTRR